MTALANFFRGTLAGVPVQWRTPNPAPIGVTNIVVLPDPGIRSTAQYLLPDQLTKLPPLWWESTNPTLVDPTTAWPNEGTDGAAEDMASSGSPMQLLASAQNALPGVKGNGSQFLQFTRRVFSAGFSLVFAGRVDVLRTDVTFPYSVGNSFVGDRTVAVVSFTGFQGSQLAYYVFSAGWQSFLAGTITAGVPFVGAITHDDVTGDVHIWQSGVRVDPGTFNAAWPVGGIGFQSLADTYLNQGGKDTCLSIVAYDGVLSNPDLVIAQRGLGAKWDIDTA